MKLYSQHLAPQLSTAPEDAGLLVVMNTTPLIDVMLVLIVMLIITIPVQLQAVKLDLPSLQAPSAVPIVVSLGIDAAGFVQWNGERLPDLATLNARIAAAAALPEQPEIHVRPSPDTPYALVAAMLVLAQRGGLRKVGVVN